MAIFTRRNRLTALDFPAALENRLPMKFSILDGRAISEILRITMPHSNFGYPNRRAKRWRN